MCRWTLFRDLSRLPAVDPGNPRRVLGIIRRGDVGRDYNVGMMRRAKRQQRADQLRTDAPDQSEVTEFILDDQAAAVGLRVHNLPLPNDCLVVAVRRQAEFIVHHGPTRLQGGDRVIIHGSHEGLAAVKNLAPRLFGASA